MAEQEFSVGDQSFFRASNREAPMKLTISEVIRNRDGSVMGYIGSYTVRGVTRDGVYVPKNFFIQRPTLQPAARAHLERRLAAAASGGSAAINNDPGPVHMGATRQNNKNKNKNGSNDPTGLVGGRRKRRIKRSRKHK